ncbi:MAG: DUF547 domain-containing protein [Minwuia sp.]|uniref:DUF547 domain-containing protein n=1 Tax=Minwuia sp. TaxID=2493630 RepID=UPI003A848A55
MIRVAASMVLLLCLAVPAAAAPEAELWPRWIPEGQAGDVDHSVWARFLNRHLSIGGDGIARIGYGAVDAASRRSLDAYVEALTHVDPVGLARAAAMTYWINLYNALTVKVVLDHYPVTSIRDIDISPGLFANGPWGAKLVRIGGEELSLDDIEHRILRPIWRDPRVHYAVNCASIGCPNLQAEPFTAGRLDAQLDAAARDFINHPRGADFTDDGLTVSSIYEWFADDFGGADEAVIAHLKLYAAPALAARLEGVTRIDDDSYDWRLNDIR